jgi:hypothetical protein
VVLSGLSLGRRIGVKRFEFLQKRHHRVRQDEIAGQILNGFFDLTFLIHRPSDVLNPDRAEFLGAGGMFDGIEMFPSSWLYEAG